MAQKSLYLFGIVLTIIVGTILNWWLCCNVSEVVVTPVATPSTTVKTNPLNIQDADGSFAYTTNDNFNFNDSNYDILRPLSSGVRDGVDSVKVYLNNNPGKFIDITGLYEAGETNSSPYPNLGIARATHIKNYFVSRGVNPKQINFYGKEGSSLVQQDSIYYGPVQFVFSGAAEMNETTLDSLAVLLRDRPLVVHFDYGESSFPLTDTQREKVVQIAKYVHMSDDVSCHIIGHTDNKSSSEFNQKLGMERAQFVKDYFVSHGIPADRITVDSKGETEPVADNTTEEGRAENRRTVITIN
ncbi:OmpA family protein [Robertkochia solimangrovi]|uniref:OmpA family protein n=1 Tax=Robertkochia solimangrovi TaxID=2213046 RepID=UPI00117D2284|nr:OmpA family protein [Robertkochia solimangrovi]TRZ45887.1 hypothetical protein DMZ48_01015 [Robertkochia solimangrovi]